MGWGINKLIVSNWAGKVTSTVSSVHIGRQVGHLQQETQEQHSLFASVFQCFIPIVVCILLIVYLILGVLIKLIKWESKHFPNVFS